MSGANEKKEWILPVYGCHMMAYIQSLWKDIERKTYQRWTLCLPIEIRYVSCVTFRLICSMESRHKKGWITVFSPFFPQYKKRSLRHCVYQTKKNCTYVCDMSNRLLYSVLVFFSISWISPNYLSRIARSYPESDAWATIIFFVVLICRGHLGLIWCPHKPAQYSRHTLFSEYKRSTKNKKLIRKFNL